MEFVFRAILISRLLQCLSSTQATEYAVANQQPELSSESVSLEDNNEDSSQWSHWSPWSDCTRSCGGGLSRQFRNCLIGTCGGSAVQYKTCNIESCPEGDADWRVMQCSIHNDEQYDGEVYSWIPVFPLPAKNECALICRAEGHNLTRMFASTVFDGTRCRPNSRDMCLAGICVPIGCDYQFSSTAVLDRCLVCGGDNSSCKMKWGTIISKLVAQDIEEILVIPSGSFNVRIILQTSESYLGIKTEDGLQGINQHSLPSEGGNYSVGSVTVLYRRPLGRNQFLKVPFELDEPLIVTIRRTKVMMQGSTADRVKFQYIARLSYGWKETRWSECSRSCALGQQVSTWNCYDLVRRERVKESFCEDRKPLDKIQECNRIVCPSRWKKNPWNLCSETCGNGFQHRQVSCVIEGPNTIQYLGDILCTGPKPATHAECNQMPCPQWFTSEWSECSVTCASGISERSVQCLDGRGVDVNGCNSLSEPETMRTCHTLVACLPGHVSQVLPLPVYLDYPIDELEGLPSYSIYRWSECSVTCGVGLKTRNITCTRFIHHTEKHVQVAEELCHHLDTHTKTMQCVEPTCPTLVPADTIQTTETSEPSDPKPTLTNVDARRQISDSLPDIISIDWSYGSSPFPDDNFIPEKSTEFPEYNRADEQYTWSQGGNSPCSVSCGGGTQSKRVICMNSYTQQVSESLCADIEPVISRQHVCNEQPCPPEWKVVSYLECSLSCGSGLKYPMEKVCSQVVMPNTDNLLPSNSCNNVPHPEPVSCNTFDCPPLWVMSMWSDCSQSCGSGTRTRSVSCRQLKANGVEEQVDSFDCEGPLPPNNREQCNEIDCMPMWIAGNFSQCSTTCGEGRRTRRVICVQVQESGLTVDIDDSLCPQDRMLPRVELCSYDVCIEPYIKGNYTSFIQSEGAENDIVLTVGQFATMYRKTTLIVTCPVVGLRKSDIRWFRGSALITGNSSMMVRAVKGGSLKFVRLREDNSGIYTCVVGQLSKDFILTVITEEESVVQGVHAWQSGEWSLCNATCMGGVQHREVTCQHSNRRGYGNSVENRLCLQTGKRQPENFRICNTHPCTTHWHAGDWFECVADCRGMNLGVQFRNVTCRSNTGNVVAISECEAVHGLTQFVDLRDCETDLCAARWYKTHWSTCSRTCGVGQKRRRVRCEYGNTRKLADPMHCEAHEVPKPIGEVNCSMPKCPEDGVCSDRIKYCPWILRMDMCTNPIYGRKCCATCSEARLDKK